MEAGSAVPTRSYTYDGATPQSLAAFLLRECREHFCAYGHCKRALCKQGPPNSGVGPCRVPLDPAPGRGGRRVGGARGGGSDAAVGRGGGASPDEFCYS